MHRRLHRLPSSQYIGFQRIFLTMCTFQRLPLFRTGRIVDPVREQLLRDAAESRIEIVAYCFMPDHLHALIAGTSDDADSRRFVQAFRQRSGYGYRRLGGKRLWQHGYFDRHLRDEESNFDVVSYIVSNPVRARICDAAIDFPHSGSSRYDLSAIVQAVQWRPNQLG